MTDRPERRLVLASASPRRRELLALLGRPFEVVVTDVDERIVPGEAGAVNVSWKVCSVAASRLPPAKVTVSPATFVVQPGCCTGSASVTPVGIWNASWVVFDPSQPCSTPKPTVTCSPAGTVGGSGSMCADATPAPNPIAAMVAAIPAASGASWSSGTASSSISLRSTIAGTSSSGTPGRSSAARSRESSETA